MTRIRELKRPIRAFFRHYTDERLAMLLAHARDGKLAYHSCCCFIGIPTADHALRGAYESLMSMDVSAEHYVWGGALSGARAAEFAFGRLGALPEGGGSDNLRRRILIPMIRAEMRRREALRLASSSENGLVAEGGSRGLPSVNDVVPSATFGRGESFPAAPAFSEVA